MPIVRQSDDWLIQPLRAAYWTVKAAQGLAYHASLAVAAPADQSVQPAQAAQASKGSQTALASQAALSELNSLIVQSSDRARSAMVTPSMTLSLFRSGRLRACHQSHCSIAITA